jgi:hypothetical protein
MARRYFDRVRQSIFGEAHTVSHTNQLDDILNVLITFHGQFNGEPLADTLLRASEDGSLFFEVCNHTHFLIS